jgi:hypothetical protein
MIESREPIRLDGLVPGWRDEFYVPAAIWVVLAGGILLLYRRRG